MTRSTLYGKLVIKRKKDNKILINRKGIFTFNARKLFLVIAQNYSNTFENVTLKNINGNDVVVSSRNSFSYSSMCNVYTMFNTTSPYSSGLSALLSNTEKKLFADVYQVENIKFEIPLNVKVHREHIVVHSISYAGALTVDTDTLINTVYIVNDIYDIYCALHRTVFDVFQFTTLELKTGESYDLVYSIAFA